MARELWQLYDEQGQPLPGQGATKADVFAAGILHAASHVWIWRSRNGKKEVLLQKRAPGKKTWPSHYDISAAGHIDLDESPIQAAVREAKEEINLDIAEPDLRLAGVHRAHLVADNGAIENEYQWLYILELPDAPAFELREQEVASAEWRPLEQFKKDTSGRSSQYVPHGPLYYSTVISALENA